MIGCFIRDLYVYPLKSGAGIRVDEVTLDRMGVSGDRRWMVVDETGTFVSQRTQPRMSLIRPSPLAGNALLLEAPGMPPLRVAAADPYPRVEITVWKDRCEAVASVPDATPWLQQFLGLACRLVYCPDEMDRPVDPTYAEPDDRVGFADGFPLLLIGQSSLDDLNARLTASGQSAVPMDRFRPNVVVEGARPYEEDEWGRVTTGPTAAPVDLMVVKPCARCATVIVDQSTAVTGPEPLRILATYRRRNGSVYFGQNVIHRGVGTLGVGDAVDPRPREPHGDPQSMPPQRG